MTLPAVAWARWSGIDSTGGAALLDELSESPLPGARYARDVVRLRLPSIEREVAETMRQRIRHEFRDLPLIVAVIDGMGET